MIELPGKIPLTIQPLFWLFAALIGYLVSGTLIGMAIWVGIILVSVIVHEMGHALTATFFKQKAKIQLIALGGVTTFDGPKLKFWQQFLITFNGPLFGFFLFIAATLLLKLDLSPFIFRILKLTQMANLFWTVVNLLPVLPLDGGQLLRIVLEAIFGVKGFKASLLIGAVIATLFALYFFMIQQLIVGAFFFLFSFQSFVMWRRSRFATGEDRTDENRQQMMQAEEALQEGREAEAKRILEGICEKVHEGVIYFNAKQYLAFLAFKQGERKKAYEILLEIQHHLADDLLCILQELAAEEKNDGLVMDLSAKCYQIAPSQKRALNNARAFARAAKAKEAGGWLQTAYSYGGLNIQAVLEEEAFRLIQNDPEFKEFLEGLS